jgi:predicted Zn-ribbon and HTH transcriptional regulator
MEERSPGPRTRTPREAIADALHVDDALTLTELSAAAKVSERDLPSHLEHLEKSLKRDGLVLDVFAARCLSCGFLFEKRSRFKRPGKCPVCRGRRIGQPRFRIVAR